MSNISEIRRDMNLRAKEHLTALVDIFTQVLAEDPDNRDAMDGKRSATYWLEDVNTALNQ
jgi:hypothetical protein